MKDAWNAGDPYEYYMGRWSRIVAQSFVDWLSPAPGLKWLDLGCGSGALSEAVINSCAPAALTAVDQSQNFVTTTQKRLGNLADCKVGNALALPLQDAFVNITVSGLVLNFIAEPDKALAEMQRVTASGGTVATYVWDYAGKMDFLNHFWDVAIALNPAAAHLHEGHRFPTSSAAGLTAVFKRAGLVKIETTALEISTNFQHFEDYWNPFLGGQGPAPTYVLSLNNSDRNKLGDVLRERLPVQADGSIALMARAWAARGQVRK